jgi:hypothetical protein
VTETRLEIVNVITITKKILLLYKRRTSSYFQGLAVDFIANNNPRNTNEQSNRIRAVSKQTKIAGIPMKLPLLHTAAAIASFFRDLHLLSHQED